MVDENTPPAATNTLLCPATPTRSGKTAPLSVNLHISSQFSTPRHRKTAGLTRQTELSTSDVTRKQWPRIGKKIPSEDIKAAIQQIFGYEPRSWQLTLAEKVLEGNERKSLLYLQYWLY